MVTVPTEAVRIWKNG